MKIISSINNDRLRHVKKLLTDKEYRYHCKEYVVEGLRSVNDTKELIDVFIKQTFNREHSFKDDYYSVSDDIYDKFSGTENSQGIFATARLNIYDDSAIKGSAKYVLLDRIQDPGNMGTIIRTAAAFKCTGVILTHGCVDPFSPKVVRSAMGCVSKINIISLENLQILKSIFVVASAKTGKDIRTFKRSGGFVLAVGNEANGLSKEVFALAKETLSIPSSTDVESLNAAISCAVMLFELQKDYI